MVTLKLIQEKLPWNMENYSEMFQASPLPHKNLGHALLHVTKASGKLSDIVNKLDHDQTLLLPKSEFGKYLADLVICAARMANTVPGEPIDLGKAVFDRVESEMGVRLEQ